MPAENITEAETMTNEPRRRRYQDDVLQLGPRKKAYVVIIHPTRCSIRIYLGGQLHLRPTDWTWPPDPPISIYCAPNRLSLRQRRERRVFSELLQIVPNLETRLREGADDDAVRIADLVRHELSFDKSIT